MVVCDQDRTADSRTFVQSFTSSGYFIHGYSVDSPAEVDEYIAEGRATIALVIPRGFASALMGDRRPPFRWFWTEPTRTRQTFFSTTRRRLPPRILKMFSWNSLP